MTLAISRIAALLCVTCAVFAYVTIARADHSSEEEEHSHASTITVTNVSAPSAVGVTPVYAPVTDVSRIQKMQELLKALQELVGLLEHQLEHEEEAHDTHND